MFHVPASRTAIPPHRIFLLTMLSDRNSTNLTPAASRIVEHCRQLVSACRVDGSGTCELADVWSAHLLLALLIDESLAGACLQRMGIDRGWLLTGPLGPEVAESASRNGVPVPEDPQRNDGNRPDTRDPNTAGLDDPDQFRQVIDHAAAATRKAHEPDGVSSAQLLMSLVENSRFVRERLAKANVSAHDLRRELGLESPLEKTRLAVDIVLNSPPEKEARAVNADDPPQQSGTVQAGEDADGRVSSPVGSLRGIWRALDANLNRAREGVRVLEDVARFVANDAHNSRLLKELRHELVAAERQLSRRHSSTGLSSGLADDSLLPGTTLAHRDTANDVGTSVTTAAESKRSSAGDLVVANSRRVQESLRCLEEFGKIVSSDFAARIKQIRYRAYEVEQSLTQQMMHSTSEPDTSIAGTATSQRHQRLQKAVLYVLITAKCCRLPWKDLAHQVLEGGADVLQLREKQLSDRELIGRARWIADACRDAGALCIINDRPDIAVLSDADGVHVGQDELPAQQARRIVGTDRLLGISTHDLFQAHAAAAAGADYIGVGPVFASDTKSFDQFPGLSFVSQVAREIQLPAFAIGGIRPDRLEELRRAGATRVAMTAGLAASENPRETARMIRQQLADESSGSPKRMLDGDLR